MNKRDRIDELEVLLYADGRMDSDPKGKAAFEERLGQSPHAMEQARAFAAQTKAMRDAYDYRPSEEIPEPLLAALAEKPAMESRSLVRAASVVAMILAAGAGGWLAAQHGDPEERMLSNLLEQSHAAFKDEGPTRVSAKAAAAADTTARAANWLNEPISIRLGAPDLSGAGFTLIGRQTVATAHEMILRLDYASPDERTFSIFLAPRWEMHPNAMEQTEQDGVSFVYWGDGPFLSAVVARLPPNETKQLAETVRAAMETSMAEPVAPTSPAPGDGQDDDMIAADTLQPAVQQNGGAVMPSSGTETLKQN